jgi:hypothetical protein
MGRKSLWASLKCPVVRGIRGAIFEYWIMPSQQITRDKRRSTRVSLRVTVEAIGVSEPLACEGETLVVNMHGALILTDAALSLGMLIEVQVYLTGKSARASVVFVDPNDCYRSGIALEKPQNIWGISLPPEDWSDSEHV